MNVDLQVGYTGDAQKLQIWKEGKTHSNRRCIPAVLNCLFDKVTANHKITLLQDDWLCRTAQWLANPVWWLIEWCSSGHWSTSLNKQKNYFVLLGARFLIIWGQQVCSPDLFIFRMSDQERVINRNYTNQFSAFLFIRIQTKCFM